MFLLLVFRKEIIMEKFRYVNGYKSTLNYLENEIAIKELRRFFENSLSNTLHLTRVTAPLFVLSKTGINDDLNGEEIPVKFNAKGIDKEIEIVHSLAKWKRLNISKYGFKLHEGLYTNMNAIRKDELRDNYHSIYVDQRDYEFIISKEDRTLKFLKETVEKIYKAILDTRDFISKKFKISANLPENITFLTSEELLRMYPDMSPADRVNEAARRYRALFVAQIGYKLSDGEAQDLRAPDYDDWALNGDIFVYNELLDDALELSSMGIRVDKDNTNLDPMVESTVDAIKEQNKLQAKRNKIAKKEENLNLYFQKLILDDKLPYTLGGGIGQSRICMFLLRKLHIGEVQSSVWGKETYDFFTSRGVNIL